MRTFAGLLGLWFGCSGGVLLGQPAEAGPSPGLAVTNGLIRWWPNLLDAREAISGQEGVVMGVLPPIETGADDATELGSPTAWVQLQPALTNEVFTVSFWVTWRSALYGRLLGQESSEGEWFLQCYEGASEFFVGPHQFQDEDRRESVQLTPGTWHHVALARRPEGTTRAWVDGRRVLDGRRPHAWPRQSRWLSVGSSVRGGDDVLAATLQDLCAFDRVLSDADVAALHERGRPRRPTQNTAARRAATQQAIPIEVFTNAHVAPPQTWTHRWFTTEDGLPGNIVKAVLPARDGYLWVGTETGLARYDGRRFRAFTAENTPALRAIGQTVWSLAEDADGTVWAGMFGGLLRIRDLEFSAFTHGLPQRFILQAEPVGDGSLWVAGFNAYLPRGPLWLRRYHPETGTSSAAVVVPGHLRRLCVATNGVWLAAEQPNQMYFWDGRTAAPTVVGTVAREAPIMRLASMPPGTGASHLRAWQNSADPAHWWGEVGLGQEGPTFHWLWDSRNSRARVGLWSGPAAPDTWLGASYDLARLRQGMLEPLRIPGVLAGTEISCLCANPEGGVWFGTEEDGLHFVQERLIRVFTTEDGLSGNDVRAVCTSPAGDLWTATAGGLSRYRDGKWSEMPRGKFRSVTTDALGRLWFGGQGGGQAQLRRDRFEPGTHQVLLGLEWQDPNTLRFAPDGTLWIADERGLTWVKPERLAPTPDGNWIPDTAQPEPACGRYAVGRELPKMFPLGLVADRDGSVWLGSLGHGLWQVAHGRVAGFTRREGLPAEHVVPVYLDDTGALWLTGEGGLTRRQGGRFQTLGVKDGLPEDLLLDLVEDDLGSFWISGKRGIHRVLRRELEDCLAGRIGRVQSLTLGPRHGLLTPECASLHYPTMAKTPDGHLWVATRNGLATFDPARVRLDTRPLRAIVEQLLVNREEWPTPRAGRSAPAPARGPEPRRTETSRLPPGSGERLEFRFTAISLAAADRVRFRYRLDDYDADWSPDTDLRLAFYTNLRPGAYRFRVKAANAHGIWSEEEACLSFVIRPYFWQTMTFRVGSVLALGALAAGLHARRLAGVRRLQELRHQQALTEEKARIAADMHDELGAALTQIVVLSEVAQAQARPETPAHGTLARISQAAREVTARMSDLVWATNPRHDTLDNLVAYLREHAAAPFEGTALQAQLEFPSHLPEARLSATFRRNLVLVLKESLHNVLKHARATQVTVRLEVSQTTLALRIRDNGCGFDPATRRDGGNGLGNMARRVQALGGDLRLHAAPGQGTGIEVSVPLPH